MVRRWLIAHKTEIAEVWAPTFAILSNFVIIISLGIAIASLWYQQRQRVAEVTLKYVEHFNSEHMLKSRNDLYRMWFDYDFSESNPLTLEKARAHVDQKLKEYTESGGLNDIKSSIASLVSYFDMVSACIGANLCDRGMISPITSDYAKNLNSLYGKYILEQRRGAPSFGKGLEILAAQADHQCP